MSISINNQSHMQALFKTNTASGVNQVKQPLPAIDNVAAPKPSAMTDIKNPVSYTHLTLPTTPYV